MNEEEKTERGGKVSRDYLSDIVEKAQILQWGKKALNIKEGGHVQMSILLP